MWRRFNKRLRQAAFLLSAWLWVSNSSLGADGTTWPGFRGEQRNGHVAKLPAKLSNVKLLWAFPLPSSGVGGVAATEDFVVVSGRDAKDKRDRFVCLDPVTGTELWRLEYASELDLDYGNSPRATPLIADPKVYLLGAGGDLHCVDLDSGEIQWHKHLVADLLGEKPPWGYAASPLLMGVVLIVQPGGSEHAIAALRADTGDAVWFTKAEQAAYASPQIINTHQANQLLCWDRRSLMGLAPETGEMIWSITPNGTTEFHVPMPLATPKGIITIGEVQGATLYPWRSPETLAAKPVHQAFELAPDMHSPILAGSLVLGVHEGLYALDVDDGLQVRWQVDDPAFLGHTSLLASDDRLLVVTERSELVLVDISDSVDDQQPDRRIVGRKQIGEPNNRTLAAPALVGDVLFVRTNSQLLALALGDE